MTRRRALLLVWTLPTAIFLAITWAAYDRVRLEVPARLSAAARTEVVRALRVVFDDTGWQAAPPDGSAPATPPRHPELERRLDGRGPAAVTVWLDGKEAARVY